MEFSPEEIEVLVEHKPASATRWVEPEGKVAVFCVLDHGSKPALGHLWVGGSDDSAVVLAEACRIARSGRIRCALLGLANAGAGVVVVPDPSLDRDVLHELVRRRFAESSIFVVAGEGCEDVSALGEGALQDTAELGRIRGEVLARCLEPLCEIGDSTALVLGCDGPGRDAAKALGQRGADVRVWDEDSSRAQALASELGAAAVTGEWTDVSVDVVVPCGGSTLIDERVAEQLDAKIVCGLAPRIFGSRAARAALADRGRWAVPEIMAAGGDLLALAASKQALNLDQALAMVSDTAAEVLASPADTHDRAISLAIARSKAATTP